MQLSAYHLNPLELIFQLNKKSRKLHIAAPLFSYRPSEQQPISCNSLNHHTNDGLAISNFRLHWKTLNEKYPVMLLKI
jgi:hypothetical protein